MLHDALELCTGPAVLRWAKTPAREVADHEVGHGLSARRAREGADVCLVGVGKMLGTCLEAADLLAADGIEATVWDPRVVKPLDPALVDHAATFGHVVTVEDGLRDGGIGAAVARELSDRCRDRPTEPRVTVLGTPTAYIPQGKADAILADLGLDAAGVAATVRSALGS